MKEAQAQAPVGLRQPRALPSLVLASFLVVASTTIILTGGGPRGAVYQLRWVLLASDLFLGLVVVSHLEQLAELWRRWSQHRCAVAAVALAVSLLPAFALHPSARGGAAVLRWIGVAMIAFAVGRLAGSGRRLVLGTFAGVTVLQVVIALAQWGGNAPLGLDGLGEADAHEIGGHYASTGLTIHPYVLAAWCVLGAAILVAAVGRSRPPPRGLTAAAVIPFAGVGLTMSRAGAVAVVLVLATLGAAAWRHPRLRLLLAGAVAATTIGVALNFPGWQSRAGTTASGSIASVTSNRSQLLDQAWGLFRDAPIFGVGPGRYVEALVERPELVELATQRPSRPVHVTPYLILVEGGVVVLPALVFLGWAVVTQSSRSGVLGVGVTLSVVPFLLLDHLHWSYPQGLLLTGLWLGTLDQLGNRASAVAGDELPPTES